MVADLFQPDRRSVEVSHDFMNITPLDVERRIDVPCGASDRTTLMKVLVVKRASDEHVLHDVMHLSFETKLFEFRGNHDVSFWLRRFWRVEMFTVIPTL